MLSRISVIKLFFSLSICSAYAVLFCEDIGAISGKMADVDDVADTADRLYIGSIGYDPGHML